MNKKIIIVLGLFLITLVVLLCLFIVTNTQQNQQSTNSPISYTTNPSPVSSAASYPITTNLISYIHPSGVYGFSYPITWEFLPERMDMGLRPISYRGFYKNEIVTTLYFPNAGADLKKQAMSYDGGFDQDWQNIDVQGKSALFYHYQSDNLNNLIYWFGDGQNAVKVMFRKFDAMSTDNHTDNSQYENDFNIILNSFHFIN